MKVKTDNMISGWSKRLHNGFLISWHINPLSGKNSLIFKLLVNNYVFLKDYMLIFFNQYLKPNYFRKHCSSSSFLLTWSRYTSLKWPWSLTWLVPCLKFMKLGCHVLLGHFGPVYLHQVSRNDDEECCFWK